MKRIFKYPIRVTDAQCLILPTDAQILCVQVQHEVPCIWALVDPDRKESNNFVIETFDTGHPIDEREREYIGTYQLKGGEFIFHVFKRNAIIWKKIQQ